MSFVSLGRLHRSSLLAVMLLAFCSRSALVCAANPVPVPVPTAPGVTVTNPAAIAKAEGIQHPFQESLDCRPSASLTCEPSFTLNNNRRLVIEYVSAICTIPTNTVLQGVGVRTTVGSGGEILHVLNHVDHPSSDIATPHIAIAAHAVRIYADAGSTVRFAAAVRSTGVPDWSCNVSLSGQSIEVP